MGTRTLFDRFDAALASCAARLWSELLDALALAGQAAAGVRCFPPGAAERGVGLDRTFPQTSEQASSLDRSADAAGPGRATNGAAANRARILSAKEVARVLLDTQHLAPGGALHGEQPR